MENVWAVTAFSYLCSDFSPVWSCLWLINWFSSLTSCQFTSKRLPASTIFLETVFVVVMFFFSFWHQLLVLSFLPNCFTRFRLWWWCLQIEDSTTLGCTGAWCAWLVISSHSIVVQILKCSRTHWLSPQTMYKQQCLKKLCSFPPLIPCLYGALKTSSTYRPEAGCRKQVTADWGNWKQLPSLFATEWVPHMNVVLRPLSLTSNDVNTALCSHSPFPCTPRFCSLDFLLDLRLTVVLS